MFIYFYHDSESESMSIFVYHCWDLKENEIDYLILKLFAPIHKNSSDRIDPKTDWE